jgi:hypothetical protein
MTPAAQAIIAMLAGLCGILGLTAFNLLMSRDHLRAMVRLLKRHIAELELAQVCAASPPPAPPSADTLRAARRAAKAAALAAQVNISPHERNNAAHFARRLGAKAKRG